MASFSVDIGQTPDDLALNRWSVQLNRIKHECCNDKVEIQFCWQNLRCFTSSTLGSKISTGHFWKPWKADHLPILVFNRGIERLLNVAKLYNGTGKAMAKAVVTTVKSSLKINYKIGTATNSLWTPKTISRCQEINNGQTLN